jgi:hypothetical protein
MWVIHQASHCALPGHLAPDIPCRSGFMQTLIMAASPDRQEADDFWLAFGISLTLVRTEDGGRYKPIVGTYRPDWSIPGMSDGWLVGGPVLCLESGLSYQARQLGR